VKCDEEEEFQLRLYFVDCPEANLTYSERSREQSQYFGVSIDETLKAGGNARDFVQKALKRTFVVYTRRATAPGRSKGVRYYGLVEVGGRLLDETLVSEGLARNKGTAVNLPDGTKSREHIKKLDQLESDARRLRLGAWATARESRQ